DGDHKRGAFDFYWKGIKYIGNHDENPDLPDYIGHFEAKIKYHYSDRLFISFWGRLAEKGDAEQIDIVYHADWDLLDWKNIPWYFQLWRGKGESLMDYDQYLERISIGFMFF
ncbi:MAG: phospholipase A, partial [Proteobacteria bacterium]|nr:phospholipase A [Pseudomonadota bacterium]